MRNERGIRLRVLERSPVDKGYFVLVRSGTYERKGCWISRHGVRSLPVLMLRESARIAIEEPIANSLWTLWRRCGGYAHVGASLARGRCAGVSVSNRYFVQRNRYCTRFFLSGYYSADIKLKNGDHAR